MWSSLGWSSGADALNSSMEVAQIAVVGADDLGTLPFGNGCQMVDFLTSRSRFLAMSEYHQRIHVGVSIFCDPSASFGMGFLDTCLASIFSL